MRSIHIKASCEYDVLVERGLLDRAGELLREVSAPGMAAIVSDDTVYALYGERTVKALEKAGYRVHSFTFPAGEGSKNLSTYADVLVTSPQRLIRLMFSLRKVFLVFRATPSCGCV